MTSCSQQVSTAWQDLEADGVIRVRCPLTGKCFFDLKACGEPQVINQYLPQPVSKNRSSASCEYFCEGACSDKPCPSWKSCAHRLHDESFMCWDGECVQDLRFCKNAQTGCPYDSLNCLRSYYLRCIQSYPNYISGSIQPTTDCYVPQCPTKYPLKCPTGLCVDDLSNCPTNPFSHEDVQYCHTYSNDLNPQYGFVNRFVPCGDGTCVSESDQCNPLMECEDISP